MKRKLMCYYSLLVFLSLFLLCGRPLAQTVQAAGAAEYRLEAVQQPAEQREYYDATVEAAAFLRRQMKARVASVTIPFQSADLPQDSLLQEIVDIAMMHTGVPTEGDYIAFQVGGWNGSMSASFDGNVYKTDLHFDIQYYTTAEQEEDVSYAVEEILYYLGIEGRNDYVKTKAIYDYICNHVRYDYENLDNPEYLLQYTAYGACVNGTSVCQGYALLLYRLLLEEGIDCRILSGTGNGDPHAWNIIGLDGRYYNADSTWDAGTAEYSFFLKSNAGFPDHDRDADYLSESFLQSYPMSETDYAISQRYEENGLIYMLVNETATVIGYSGTPVDLVIPPAVAGYPVCAISADAFTSCQSLHSVELPASVKWIEDGEDDFLETTMSYYLHGAFSDCTALQEVIIPANSVLEQIGINAFYNCSALESIRLPESVKSLQRSCLDGCRSLTELELPAGLKSFGQNCLHNSGIISLAFPVGIEDIDTAQYLPDLISVEIPEGNSRYRSYDGVLYAKYDLPYAEVDGEDWYGWVVAWYPWAKPDLVYKVPEFVEIYFNTSALSGLYIGGGSEEHYVRRELPESIDIGDLRLGSAAIEENLIISDTNPYYTMVDGVLYDKSIRTLICVPGRKEGTLVIPNGVTEIAQSAASHSMLSEVIIPDSVVRIKDNAFEHSPNLVSIRFPDKVNEFGWGICADCISLKNIQLPSNLVTLNSVVMGCTSLEYLSLPKSLTSIEPYAFYTCYLLREIMIPPGVTDIGEMAFGHCGILSAIYIPQSLTDIAGYAFWSCGPLTDIYYSGSEEEWACISKGPENTGLNFGTIHFNYFYRLPGEAAGWQKIQGKWYYFDQTGKPAIGWKQISGKWYYFNLSGVMQTGWQKVNKKWYYLASGGAMQTGWQEINDKWYYFASDGAMQTGWQEINDKWYYFASGGVMQTGWQEINGKWYYFASGGAVQTGWQEINGKWYYFASGGVMQTGWQEINGKWYYFTSGGAMVTGWKQIKDVWYFFKPGGVMAAREWYDGYYLNADGSWTYPYKASWKQNAKGWWFGDPSGWYAKSCTITINDKTYTFDAGGYLVE